MDDILAVLHKLEWPSWAISAIAILWVIADKLKLYPRPRTKSDREMLSLDEKDFRIALMGQCHALSTRCSKLEDELRACHTSHDELYLWISGFLDEVRALGLEALIKMTPPAPFRSTAIRTEPNV